MTGRTPHLARQHLAALPAGIRPVVVASAPRAVARDLRLRHRPAEPPADAYVRRGGAERQLDHAALAYPVGVDEVDQVEAAVGHHRAAAGGLRGDLADRRVDPGGVVVPRPGPRTDA